LFFNLVINNSYIFYFISITYFFTFWFTTVACFGW
jgi:hypothetical protein